MFTHAIEGPPLLMRWRRGPDDHPLVQVTHITMGAPLAPGECLETILTSGGQTLQVHPDALFGHHPHLSDPPGLPLDTPEERAQDESDELALERRLESLKPHEVTA